MTTVGPVQKSDLKLSLLVFFAALLLYSYLLSMFFPRGQFLKYVTAAQMFLRHELPRERLLDFSPSYFYLHVIFQKAFANPGLAMQIFHIILMALTSLLAFRLLSKFFRPVLALIGAFSLILNYAVMVYAQTFEPEVLALFCLLGFLYFASRSSWADHLFAGLFLGLSLWTRPNFAVLLVVVPVYFYLTRKSRAGWKAASLIFLIPGLLSLSLLWARSTRIAGVFTPVIMNPGTVFYEGNNPDSWGVSAIYPPLVYEVSQNYSGQPDYQHEIYRLFARKVTGRNLSVPEVNRYWASKAINFIVDEPQHYLKLMATKTFHLFHAYEWHDLWNAHWNQEKLKRAWIPTVSFALISALALLGIIVGLRNWRSWLLFYTVLLSQMGFMLLAYVSSRQRLVILPVFLFFACAALDYFIKNRKHLLGLVLVLPLCALFFVPTDLMREQDHLWESLRVFQQLEDAASKSREAMDYDEASRAVSYALAWNPWLIDFCRLSSLSFEPEGFAERALDVALPQDSYHRFDRGVLSLEAGKLDDAQRIFKRLVTEKSNFSRHFYLTADLSFHLGRIAALKGERDEALRWLSQALKRSPGDPSILSHLFVLTERPEYREKLFRYFDDLDAHFYLGTAYLESREPVKAARDFAYVVEKVPEYRRGVFYLAAAWGESGAPEQGARLYQEAMKNNPDPVLLEAPILNIFKGICNRDPENTVAWADYGVVLRQYGHFEEAIEIQRKVIFLDPSDSRAKKEVAFLERLLQGRK